MSRYTILFLVALLFTGCATSKKMTHRVNSREVSRVILIYSEKLRHEQRLHLEDSVVFYEKGINRIRLDYSSMDNIDVWTARALLVDTVEEFVDRINQNAAIYPHLSKTPFDVSSLEVNICFKSYYNKFIDLKTIGLITLRGGIVNYVATDALDCDTECWHKRSEFYWQSRDFITFKRQGEALYGPKEEENGKSALHEERFFFDDFGPSF